MGGTSGVLLVVVLAVVAREWWRREGAGIVECCSRSGR